MADGRLIQGDAALMVKGVSTDTRKDMTGSLFVPIVGEVYDAHQFHVAALSQGAVAALWQKDHPRPDTTLALIEVDDTLLALQRLAAKYREQLDIRVVGVTGSNGKTSTKDMITTVLAERFRVQKTLGNLNNHIGLPLMLLALEEETEVAVLEMGMSNFGEIGLLTALSKPDIGVITNIGEAHIEFLGTRGGIADAKCELIEGLYADGRAILFGDEPLLRERASKSKAPITWFGFEEGNSIRATEVESFGVAGTAFSLADGPERYKLPVPGIHQVGNALAAIAVGLILGLTRSECQAGLAKATLTAGRVEVKKARAHGTVIDDSYNASPTSMRAALKMLADLPAGVKVAVLGGMLELGPDSQKMHREIGTFVATLPLDRLVCVGELAEEIAAGAREGGFPLDRIFATDDRAEVVRYLEELLQAHGQAEPSVTVLVKASNGIKLAEVVRALT
jgi:UDP-N-acetylmuramoyl-tripeptide--D-alanyl-D-alanine ligase